MTKRATSLGADNVESESVNSPIPFAQGLPPYLKGWWIFLIGAGYGLLMRLFFGLKVFNESNAEATASGVMLVSFLLLVPLVMGALTVLLASRGDVGRAMVLPWLSTILFLSGCALLLLEGSICILLALPIFLVLSSLGGLAMWMVLRIAKPPKGAVCILLILPIATGLAEFGTAAPTAIDTVDASLHIAAPPESLWRLINSATDIAPSEMQGLAWSIGVPRPIEAITVDTETGRVRKSRWEQGVHFDEPIVDWDENRYIRWHYVFSPDSIPPGALDEHVAVGGQYFDLIDTSYRLEPESDGTRLSIHVTYRVSTRFNGYARWLARNLIDNSAEAILGFYRTRCEHDGIDTRMAPAT